MHTLTPEIEIKEKALHMAIDLLSLSSRVSGPKPEEVVKAAKEFELYLMGEDK